MKFQPVLDEIVATLRPQIAQCGQGEHHGKVASYIPALARVDARQFGIALRTCEGEEAGAGDFETPFSIQSVSKLFTLTLAMQRMGDALWERIGREPSGNPFNSLVQLENEQGKPRNPFINAGAIAVADRLVSQAKASGPGADGGNGGNGAKDDILALMASLCGEPIAFDDEVAQSEADTGFRNVALANFMKSFGKIDNDVATVLDTYFHQCALRMSCRQLARAAAFLCRDGAHPIDGQPDVTGERQTRRINALMLTCGTYDAAGDVAFSIGLPCKSGVGGGIVAVVPDTLTLCVWSPALDATGNSLLGMKALELFVARTGLSVF
ncbi:glutaminase [Variovorax sp. J22G73]|uniref:glutaminase n=1 Tax=unclassified Variovorax TaxID=663243 RepID=UPI000E329B09|nr:MULTISPECIES: glutaminase [unclassified Variovorax]MDM0008481.1 glutaminase [Variovorax sp. J22R203]MDM0100988.1 glutaminase [Variovorax sp. J22G73]